MRSLPRRLVAEALGTCLLVATVVGSGVMADRLSADDGVALLGNTLPTAAILVVLITILGPVSGAHFNPVVSLVFALRREIGWFAAALYVGAQLAGGILGTLLAHLMFELPPLVWGVRDRTGPAQWLSEGVAAFGLVLVILGGLRTKPALVPVLVGLFIGAAYWFTASTSFANPAVTIARALTDTFAGIAPGSVGGYVAAQVAGGLVALGVASWLFPESVAATARE
jgi:glycerol uptake facilitator-like aquaporin